MREVDLTRKQKPAQDVDLTAQTAGSDTPPAYSFTPPATTPVATTEDKKPELSDYNYFSQWAKEYAEPAMSQEEVDRRSRGAAASQAVAGLGNAISAFTNLAYAGEAPSQTLPQLPDANYSQLEDKARGQRQQYNAALYRGKASDYDAYQKALAQWNAREVQKAELARKRDNDALANYKWQKEQNYKAWRDELGDKQKEKDRKLKEKQLDETRGYHNQRLAIERDKANDSKNNGGNGKKQTNYPPLSIKGDKGYSRQYDMNDDAEVLRMWGEYKKAGLYNPLVDGNEPDTPDKIRTYLMTRLGERDKADSGKLQFKMPVWGE